MTDDSDSWPRAIPLTQEQLRRAYERQVTCDDPRVAALAKYRLKFLQEEPASARDEAPELTEDYFNRAAVYDGKTLIRPGHAPKADGPRVFYASEEGWETIQRLLDDDAAE